MNLNITGHQLSITTALKNYIDQTFMKNQRHFCDRLDVHMVLEVKKLVNKVEITTRLPGKDLHVEVENSNMYRAIDLIAQKMDRQIIKYKETHSTDMHSAKLSGQ